ncbi:hypothetical protein QZL74_37045 (plasmid) [Burkholderia gladioli pv. alliicola]|uniref:hypothetical protein n=1 Tax=Burkholderia gladioli TaxID=28095 RepID=UPI000FDBD5CF|nr:hypothetical protein [Burkholderia gladioli]
MKFRNLFNAIVGLSAVLILIAAAIGTGHLLAMTHFFSSGPSDAQCLDAFSQHCTSDDRPTSPTSAVGYFFWGIVVWVALAFIAAIIERCYAHLQTFGEWIINECKLLRKQEADNR